MPSPFRSSRLRYLQYRREARKRQGEIGPSSFGHRADTAPRKLHKRSRSFLQLTGEFLKLLRGHRAMLALILAVVACSTILGLMPIYGTKLVFDNVLGDHPLPKYIPPWLHLPSNRRQLLTFTLFVVYLANLLATIAVLAGSATALQNSLAGLDRILDLLSEQREMPSRPGAIVVNPARVAGRITLRDVCFSYPDSPIAHRPAQNATPALVLQNIHLDVHPGEMIALVGPSGAGKTTLCNLIARFYDPTAGSISLDGADLRDITVESYRHLLGIVEQDTFLFDGTIADNIAYGRRDASKEDITQAARAANAHEFITKFPSAYDTLIGERGVKLSGGQRQRLTIARALLADPRLLILDEATSNLDTESERLIQGSLQTLMSGRTSFVIAHRLSTIAHADRIVVLEEGRIIEQGKHDDLMQASGRYREMVDLQTSPPPSPTMGMRRKHD